MAKAKVKGKTKPKVRIEPKSADQAPEVEGVEIDISAGTEEIEALTSDKESLQKDKEALQKEIEELKDKDLRRQAEFENFRKRTEKEKAQQFDAGAAHVLEKILPVLDNFERGFQTVEEADREDAFVDGMSKVYKQLTDELEKLGVVPIEAVGKEFDPNIHNAVMQVDTGEVASGFVAQEMQKGYMYHDTVLRFSMVAVQS